MKYGDFSSLVQLGVGLHAGTAILQMYGEIGVQPMLRIIARIKSVLDDTNPEFGRFSADLNRLESDFEIFRIRLFNEFKFLIVVNAVFCVVLLLGLIFVSYQAEVEIPAEVSVVLVALSVLPSPITLAVLWHNASKEMKPMMDRAAELEKSTLRSLAS